MKSGKRIQSLTILSILLILGLCPSPSIAENCLKMEERGLLLYQQFRQGKTCKESASGKRWTNCLFKAADTEILLMRAVRKSGEDSVQGFHGSGFKVISVGPDVKVGLFAGKDLGVIIRVERKNPLDDVECFGNEAYITLDADVLSPKEINRFRYGPLHLPEMAREQIAYMQKNLVSLGYDPGKVDGVMGQRTEAALENYKQYKALPEGSPDDVILDLLAVDAFFKDLTELKLMGETVWEPSDRSPNPAPSRPN